MKLGAIIHDNVGILRLPDRFTFELHREFRAESEKLIDSKFVKEVVVDFQHTSYLDSAALGMLLLLRDKCKTSITLRNVRGAALSVIEIANFHKLFQIA